MASVTTDRCQREVEAMSLKLPIPGKPDEGTPHVGIVFVHGIGFQRPGETLLDWSGGIETALVGWRTRVSQGDISKAQRNWPRDLVESSDVDLSGTRRSYVTLRIPGVSTIADAGPQRWTFTEAFWAAKVESVSLRLVVDWTGREGVTWRVVEGVLKKNAPKAFKPYVELAGKFWLGLFVSALTSAVLLGYIVLRSLLALIPIQAVQDFVTFGKGERFLVGWWGDARTLVRDPVQSGTVRKSLDDAIGYLRREHGCKRIVLLAHSGGTIVAYMTLSDPELSARADLLITHGQAISLGRRLEDLERDSDVSAQVQPSVTRIMRVAKPEDLRVRAWRDFYGTHDPAPISTPSDIQPANALGSATKVVNLRSIREDHGGYWTNDEEFVLPIIKEIERVGGGKSSRFTRKGACFGDDIGVERRHTRVAMRSLWGRLALVAPLVAMMLAAGVAGGKIQDATALDLASDVMAANYQVLPLHEVGTWLSDSVRGLTDDAVRNGALAITRMVLFFVFLGAAAWAILPVGNWSRMPVGGVAADLLFSASIPAAAVAAWFGWGPVVGIGHPDEFLIVMATVLLLIAGSIITYQFYKRLDLSRFVKPSDVPSAWVSMGILTLLIIGAASLAVSFLVDDATRRWIVDAVVALLLVQAVVRIGMWRWNAWDAAERQWFRGPRSSIPSRKATYGIAIGLGLMAFAVVILLSGLVAALVAAGWPRMADFPMAVAVVGGLFVLGLVVRDASMTETVQS
jgi:hypothetical protein